MAFDDNRESIPFGSDFGIISTDEHTANALDDFLTGDEAPVQKPKDTTKAAPNSKNPVNKPKDEEKIEEEPEEDPQDLIEKLLSQDEEEDTEASSDKKGEEGIEKSKEGEDEEENQFSVISKELFELGIFTYGEDETAEDIAIETPEQFRDRFEYEKKKGAGEALEAFLARFGQPYAEMFEAVYIKGVDPVEWIQTSAKITDLAEIDLTEETNQERIVREKLTRDGYDQEDIDAEIARLKNYNDLENRSKADQKVLLKQLQKEKQEKELESQQQRQREAIEKQQKINATRQIIADKLQKKEFDGIPVDRQFADEINAYLTKDRFKLADGKLITEFEKELLDLEKPENFNMKVKMAMLLKMVKKDPTLSKIQKKAVTKETNEIFRKLVKDKKKQSNQITDKNKNEATEGKWF